MKSSEVLTEARKLLARRNGWCKGSYAQNICGDPIEPQSEYAVKFCSIGAIKRFVKSNYNQEMKARDYLTHATGTFRTSIGTWNDRKRRTKKDVLNAFDKAIALAKKDEKK